MSDMVQATLTLLLSVTLAFGTIVIWIFMGYYSIRIFRSFGGGVLSRGWKYICIAVPFLILGQLATGINGFGSVTNLQQDMLSALGASLSLVGGLLIIMGFRLEYNAWNPKEMRQKTPREDKVSPKTSV